MLTLISRRYDLAVFELSNKRSLFTGDDHDGGAPLVSVERKLRQAISLLNPIVEGYLKAAAAAEAGAGGGARGKGQSEHGRQVFQLASKLSYALAKLTHSYKCWSGRSFDTDEALGFYAKAKEYGRLSLPAVSAVTTAEGWDGWMGVGIHEAVLLANAGRLDDADASFRSVLYRSQHDIAVKSCVARRREGGSEASAMVVSVAALSSQTDSRTGTRAGCATACFWRTAGAILMALRLATRGPRSAPRPEG